MAGIEGDVNTNSGANAALNTIIANPLSPYGNLGSTPYGLQGTSLYSGFLSSTVVGGPGAALNFADYEPPPQPPTTNGLSATMAYFQSGRI